MKRIFAGLLVLVSALVLIACNGDSGKIKLTVWASDLDQEITQELIDGFIAEYETEEIKFDITLGALSEAQAKDQVLADLEAAADVFTFADDQFDDLYRAGVFQEITEGKDEVIAANGGSNAAVVQAATKDGKLYAYPMTSDNGYFLFYDKSVYSEEDVETLDGILSRAATDGSKFTFDLKSGWYMYSFFGGAGLELGYDGEKNHANWNQAPKGIQVTRAILEMANHAGYNFATDAEFAAGLKDGTYTAGVNGVWNAEVAEEAWGDNYAATKLPTYTLGGEQVQMSSFAGFKLVGVNQTSANPGWAMRLANWLTNEDSQLKRFEARGLGPSNVKAASSEAVQANPAIAALAQQAEFSAIQRVEGSYWSPTESLGTQIVERELLVTATDAEIQALLDEMVQGINTPAVE